MSKSITDQLEKIRKALHTGQASAVKIDAQRAFVEVEQFISNVLDISELALQLRDSTGGHFEFDVSGNGESWAGYVGSNDGANCLLLLGRQRQSFEKSLQETAAAARKRLRENRGS